MVQGLLGNKILLGDDMFSQQDSPCLVEDAHVFPYFSMLHNSQRKMALLEDDFKSSPPIGLKLAKTSPFVKSMEDKLNGKTNEISVKNVKPEHFPMHSLTIGSFRVVATYTEDLFARCYYRQQTLVWEILENSVKKRIETQWHNILAMRAIIEKNKFGILHIELDKAPAFFIKATRQQRKGCSSWVSSQDFTGGQASKYRTYYLRFPPGVLDLHYQKLIRHDNRLLHLSQRPFPSLPFRPYFDSQSCQSESETDMCIIGQHLRGSKSKTTPASQQQQQSTLHLNGTDDSTSPTSDISSLPNEAMLQEPWDQGLDYCGIPLAMDSSSCARDEQPYGSGSNNSEFSDFLDIILAECACDHPPTLLDESEMANIYAS